MTLTRTKPIARKRATPRRHRRPLCTRQRCSRPVIVDGMCRTHLVVACDQLARERCLQLHPVCSYCGATQDLQWSHHLRRGYMAIRWDLDNSTMHCAACHKRFTEHPSLHVDWIVRTVGERTYARLLDGAYGPLDPETGRRAGPPSVANVGIVDWYRRLQA